MGSSFALCVTHKKGIFLLRVCILDDASDLPRDILQFVLQERKERVFEKEPTEKHTSKERERERRERERKRRKRPAIENFSTYSLYKMVAATLAKRAISELFTQQVRAPTVSGSAAEAKRRSIYFFRDICRVSAFSIFSSQSPPSKSLNNGAFGYLCSFVFCVQ